MLSNKQNVETGKAQKITERNFDENCKIFLVVTIFPEEAVFAGVHVLDGPNLCIDVLLLNQWASKLLKVLQKTLRQGIFYASFTHFDREFELDWYFILKTTVRSVRITCFEHQHFFP